LSHPLYWIRKYWSELHNKENFAPTNTIKRKQKTFKKESLSLKHNPDAKPTLGGSLASPLEKYIFGQRTPNKFDQSYYMFSDWQLQEI